MRLSLLALVCALCLAGCGKDDSPTAPSAFPISVTLAPGQQQNAGGLLLRFNDVIEDSRCPVDVMCVWAGEGTLSVSASTGGISGHYQMTINNADKKRLVVGDYQVELVTLQPYPQTGVTAVPSAYRATFTITKD